MKSNDEKEKCSDSFIDIPCESIPKFTEKLSVESSLSQQLAKAQRILRDYSQTEIASCKQLYRHEKFLEDNESKCTIHHVKSSMKQKRNLQCSSVCKQELFDLSQNYVKKCITNAQQETLKHSIDFLPSSIICLKDLSDGTWLWRKSCMKLAKTCQMYRKIKKLKKTKQEMKSSKRKIVYINEAEIPKSIEEQISILLEAINKQQKQFVINKDHSKSIYLKNYCVRDDGSDYYDRSNLEGARKRITGKLRKREDFNEQLTKLESEIVEGYKQFLVTSWVEYSILHIRAPIPWHQFKLTANHFMQHNLFIGNEILRNIQDLYFLKYQNVMIINIQDIGTIPIPAFEVEPRINHLCDKAMHLLINEWLADIADIILEKKHVWSCYVQEHYNASTVLIEKYFRSINTLLSKHLRMVVMKTLTHIQDFFMEYSSGNYFKGNYKDLMFLKTPFMTITVEAELGTENLHCRPSISEVREIISKCFDKIITVTTLIPKIETILFPELRKQEYLSSVSRYEDVVNAI